MNKRKRYAASFKAKVALEALRGEKTMAELSAKYGVHPTMITGWKKKAAEGMVDVFSSKGDKSGQANESEIKDLHAKIGQLTVERDFLSKAFGQ